MGAQSKIYQDNAVKVEKRSMWRYYKVIIIVSCVLLIAVGTGLYFILKD